GQRPGLGEYFLSAVQSTLTTIQRHPEIFVSVYTDATVAPYSARFQSLVTSKTQDAITRRAV
ncbi:MAG: hypothetical protein ABI612_26710, partial [Betaproteobacteria bacterium]